MAAILWLLGQLFRSRPQGLRPEKVPTAAKSLIATKRLRMRDVASQLLTAGFENLVLGEGCVTTVVSSTC
jgi:hypothetical protein